MLNKNKIPRKLKRALKVAFVKEITQDDFRMNDKELARHLKMKVRKVFVKDLSKDIFRPSRFSFHVPLSSGKLVSFQYYYDKALKMLIATIVLWVAIVGFILGALFVMVIEKTIKPKFPKYIYKPLKDEHGTPPMGDDFEPLPEKLKEGPGDGDYP